MYDKIIVHTDGACKSNPGAMGIAFIVDYSDKTQYRYSEYIGFGTNNIAEYSAIISALEFLIKGKVQSKEVVFKSDSQLVVNQINKKWQVNEETLITLNNKVKDLLEQVKENVGIIKFEWVRREQNKSADKLVNAVFGRH